MTTTSNSSVPLSRLNIKYRTRIDGQVKQKELPLKLLVAGDFSGRGVGDQQRGRSKRQLPLLDKRVIHVIGRAGSLESVLANMRIGLPVPGHLTYERDFVLEGKANVLLEKRKDEVLVLLRSAQIEGAEVESGGSPKAGAKSNYRGEIHSFGLVPLTVGSASPPAGPTGQAKFEDLAGWVEPKSRQPGEPPTMFELLPPTQERPSSEVSFEFVPGSDPNELLLERSTVELNVPIKVTVRARQVIPLMKIADFEPDRVAAAVPEIRRLLVLRWLVSQARSMIASNPVLRKKCREMFLTTTLADSSTDPVGEIDLKAAPKEPSEEMRQLKEFVAKLSEDNAFLVNALAATGQQGDAVEVSGGVK